MAEEKELNIRYIYRQYPLINEFSGTDKVYRAIFDGVNNVPFIMKGDDGDFLWISKCTDIENKTIANAVDFFETQKYKEYPYVHYYNYVTNIDNSIDDTNYPMGLPLKIKYIIVKIVNVIKTSEQNTYIIEFNIAELYSNMLKDTYMDHFVTTDNPPRTQIEKIYKIAEPFVHVLEYFASDKPEPLSVSLNTLNMYQGGTVIQCTIFLRNEKLELANVMYEIETSESEDKNSWEKFSIGTTILKHTFIISDDVKTFRVRVRAFDNIGYKSDWIYSDIANFRVDNGVQYEISEEIKNKIIEKESSKYDEFLKEHGAINQGTSGNNNFTKIKFLAIPEKAIENKEFTISWYAPNENMNFSLFRSTDNGKIWDMLYYGNNTEFTDIVKGELDSEFIIYKLIHEQSEFEVVSNSIKYIRYIKPSISGEDIVIDDIASGIEIEYDMFAGSDISQIYYRITIDDKVYKEFSLNQSETSHLSEYISTEDMLKLYDESISVHELKISIIDSFGETARRISFNLTTYNIEDVDKIKPVARSFSRSQDPEEYNFDYDEYEDEEPEEAEVDGAFPDQFMRSAPMRSQKIVYETRMKSGDDEYADFVFESESDSTYRPNGNTVEQDLSKAESNIGTLQSDVSKNKNDISNINTQLQNYLPSYTGTSSVPSISTAGKIIVGYNKVYVKTGNGSVITLEPIKPAYHVGSSSPSDRETLWVDTSGSAPLLRYYDGSRWSLVKSVYHGGTKN